MDRLTPGRRINLGRVDDGEIKSRIAFLFANRWQDVDPAEADLESNPCNGIVLVANLDYMPARYLRSSHLRSHRVIAVTGKAINNSADDEVTAKLAAEAIELVDIALTVADMDAAIRSPQQLNRLAQIVEPADAFLRLDRHPRRIDPTLELRRALELVPAPELHCRQSQGKPLGRHREARMHQDPADLVMP